MRGTNKTSLIIEVIFMSKRLRADKRHSSIVEILIYIVTLSVITFVGLMFAQGKKPYPETTK